MEDTYKAFERGTAAGNMLYKLYNGKKRMDSTLDRDLLARLQEQRRRRELQAAPKPKPVPRSKAYVNVPKPTGYVRSSDIHQCGRVGRPMYGRRLQPLVEESTTPPPEPRKYLGEEEKVRLAGIMHRGTGAEPLPPVAPPVGGKGRRFYNSKTPQQHVSQRADDIAGLRELFADIEKELHGRQAALEIALRQPVRSRKREALLRAEVADRVTQMRQVDQLIKDEERVLKENLMEISN